MTPRTLLEVNDLKKHFPLGGGLFGRSTRVLKAVDGLSFTVARGETLSLVGESGCGKSTVAKALMRLYAPTAGQVVLDGRRIDDLSAGTLRPLRRHIQMVFQDPFSSLNPRMRVRAILAEPIRNFGLARNAADLDAKLASLMDRVGLPREALGRFPHEFSGGQRQRIGIARALAAEPDLIICDEPVSALDVSVQAQIVNLLRGPAARARPHLSVHLARPRRRRAHVPPGGGDVSRQDRRDRPRRDLSWRPSTPTRRRCSRRCRSPSPGAGRTPDRAQGRRAEPDRPAVGLPLPHPLPVRLRPLPGRGAGPGLRGRRPLRRLPPQRRRPHRPRRPDTDSGDSLAARPHPEGRAGHRPVAGP